MERGGGKGQGIWIRGMKMGGDMGDSDTNLHVAVVEELRMTCSTQHLSKNLSRMNRVIWTKLRNIIRVLGIRLEKSFCLKSVSRISFRLSILRDLSGKMD